MNTQQLITEIIPERSELSIILAVKHVHPLEWTNLLFYFLIFHPTYLVNAYI